MTAGHKNPPFQSNLRRPGHKDPLILSNPNVHKTVEVFANKANDQSNHINVAMEKFSSWTRLKKVIAWVLCYCTSKTQTSKVSAAKQRKLSATNQMSVKSHHWAWPSQQSRKGNHQVRTETNLQGRIICLKSNQSSLQRERENGNQKPHKEEQQYLQAWSCFGKRPHTCRRTPAPSTNRKWCLTPSDFPKKASHRQVNHQLLSPTL